jgi:outer membrane protein TolC
MKIHLQVNADEAAKAGANFIASEAWAAVAARGCFVMQWNLFEAGSIVANIHVQNARQEEALNQYQQTILVALEDVENALTAYGREQVRRQSLSQSVAADEKALELAEQLYKSGLVDFLRVLDSEASLDSA